MALHTLNSIKIFIIVISITKVNCVSRDKSSQDCEHVCVKYSECPTVFHLMRQTPLHPYIKYCNELDNTVCCPDITSKKITIAEKKCLEYTRIKGFCPIHPFIINGLPAKPHEFPFMVAVQSKKPTDGQYEWICGGTLISPRFILTAAHCFDDIDQYPETKYSVLLGAHNTSSSGIRYNITPIIHPYYNPKYSYADLALLKLEDDVDITTNNVKPACLARTDGSEITEFSTAGWGYNGTSHKPNELLKGTLFRTDGSKCEVGEVAFNVTTHICTRPKEKIGDVCQGDSGGPIFTTYADHVDCLSEVFGVVNSGQMCNVEQSFTRHARVSFFREWIESEVWPDESEED